MSNESVFTREYRERASWKQFFGVYIQNTLVCDTYEEAYQKTEEKHRQVYKRRCYSNYNSFRNAKTRKMKTNNAD